MKTPLYVLTLCSLALAVPAARAQSGHILILKNDRTLEGDIVRKGDHYVIRRPVGEFTLPADRAQKLCADWDEAYAFLRSQTNLRDPDERLRLARWCQQRSLLKQAQAEAEAAVQMRPGHAESVRLLRHLQRNEQSATSPATQEPAKSDVTPLPAIDLNSDALSLFTTRVQPILMNACASCHCNGRGGSFQLMRVSNSSTTNRTATQHNLAAALRRVDLDRPAMSLLLIKALSDHGGANQAPIKKRESPAYRSLEDWLHATIASNPHLRELPELRNKQTAAVTVPMPPPAEPGKHLPAVPVPVEARAVPAVASPSPPREARPLNGSAAAPAERDEYDPAEFNRRAQPPRPGPN
jgi:hypothetical protein